MRTCTHAFLDQKGAGQGDSEHKHERFVPRSLCFVWPPPAPSPPLLASGGREGAVDSDPLGLRRGAVSHLLGDLELMNHLTSLSVKRRK